MFFTMDVKATLEDIIKAITSLVTAVWLIIQLFVKKSA